MKQHIRNSSCVYLWIYARPVSNVNVNDFSTLPQVFFKLMNLRQRKVAIREQTQAKKKTKQTHTFMIRDTIRQNLWWINCLATWARIMKNLRQKIPHMLMRLSDGQKCLFTHRHFRNDLEWQKTVTGDSSYFLFAPQSSQKLGKSTRKTIRNYSITEPVSKFVDYFIKPFVGQYWGSKESSTNTEYWFSGYHGCWVILKRYCA